MGTKKTIDQLRNLLNRVIFERSLKKRGSMLRSASAMLRMLAKEHGSERVAMQAPEIFRETVLVDELRALVGYDKAEDLEIRSVSQALVHGFTY